MSVSLRRFADPLNLKQIGATKNVAWRFRNEGIRCNAVLPGAIDSSVGQTIAQGKQGGSNSHTAYGWDPEAFAEIE